VSLLFITLALLIGDSGSSAQVTVTKLDGTTFVGELSEWNEQGVAVETKSGKAPAATEELLSIRWPVAQSGGDVSPATVLVELTDGTAMPADQFRVTGSEAVLILPASVPSDHREQHIPTRHIAAARLQRLEPAAAEQWSEIRAQDFTSDVIVILKRNGQSLDYVEGVLRGVTEEKVEFELDGEKLRVDRSKVAGLVYFRADQKPQPEPACTVHSRTGLRANAVKTRLADGVVSLTTSGGVKLNWPLEDIRFADFSAGKILYLSDVEQASVVWTPLVGLPDTAQAAAKYGQPRRDQAAYGGPLTLATHESVPSTGSMQLQSYSKGLAVHSRTEMVFRLPSGYSQFLATAGIEPVTSTTGNVQLTIFGDDKLLFEANIAGSDQPREIELNVEGVKRLKLLVDFGRNLDTGDWLNLCDARLIK
jgi:hypothetical protein